MWVYLGAICRRVLCAAAVVGLAAVLLGRYGGEPRADSTVSRPVRFAAVPLHAGLSNYPVVGDGGTRWLMDRKTGKSFPCAVPGLDRFELLGCSPWCDGAGQYHLALRYKQTEGKGSRLRLVEMGLACCTYPERRILNQGPVYPLPLRAVCWLPDRSDTIVYAAAGGPLFRYTFTDLAKSHATPPEPQPIRWRVASLADRRVFIQDLYWPRNPALGGRLLAALCFCDGSCSSDNPLELWWLQLDPDGQAIVSAGPMVEPEEVESAEVVRDDRRQPVVGTTRDREAAAGLHGTRTGPIGVGVVGGADRRRSDAGRARRPDLRRPQAGRSLRAAGTGLLLERAVDPCRDLGETRSRCPREAIRRRPGRSRRGAEVVPSVRKGCDDPRGHSRRREAPL